MTLKSKRIDFFCLCLKVTFSLLLTLPLPICSTLCHYFEYAWSPKVYSFLTKNVSAGEENSKLKPRATFVYGRSFLSAQSIQSELTFVSGGESKWYQRSFFNRDNCFTFNKTTKKMVFVTNILNLDLRFG